MNILLIYPKYPDSFWSFRHALRFVSKKAAVPPLGLITVSAMLPKTWDKKLVDMNVSMLHEKDLFWADYVFISAMYIQKKSVREVIDLCLKHHKKIIAGGPLFTQEFDKYPEINHFILNEAEITLPLFLNDLIAGRQAQKIYQSKENEFADLSLTPVPDYHLLIRKAYAFMNIQITRGCPFGCDFCEITSLLGRRVRLKSPLQVIKELDVLYHLKWRGDVFIVDDNLIGNKKEFKNRFLPIISSWMHEHNYPFSFSSQASIDIADDEELMRLMVDASFQSTFIGIETPSEKSLNACHKSQNKNRDLIACVRKIHGAGLQVSGGFIVGFDSDTSNIFQQQIDFIQKSGIVSAMVGLLNAPKNTRLYQRLVTEGRLITEASGSNTDFTMNFIPNMNYKELLNGYKTIIHNIYTVKPYYKRIREFLTNYYPNKKLKRFNLTYLIAFFKSIVIIGIINRGRFEYWKFLIWTILRRPGLFMEAVKFAVYGYHYRKVYRLR